MKKIEEVELPFRDEDSVISLIEEIFYK